MEAQALHSTPPGPAAPSRGVTAEASSPERVARKPPGKMGARTVVSLLLIVVIVTAGMGAARFVAGLRVPPVRNEPAPVIRAVQVFETESHDVQELISGFGTARPMKQVVISAQVAGEIVEILEPLKIGQPVAAANIRTQPDGQSRRTEGDVIARIDPQNYQERVDQAEDTLREEQTELDRLAIESENLKRRLQIQEKSLSEYRKEYERVKRLVEQGVLSDSNLTTAELDLQRYEDSKEQLDAELLVLPARVRQVQARIVTRRHELELAKLELQRTEVKSPISGAFSQIHIDRGQYVRVGDPLVTITNSESVEIPVGLALQDYQKIAPQLQEGASPVVRLRTGRITPQEWTGVVVRAAPVADASTRTVEVYVVVDNRDQAAPLLPGTFVTVAIDGPIYRNVIPIPRDTMYRKHIFVAEGDRAQKRKIESIAVLESLLLVKQGLTAGEQVIMTNLDILAAGDQIRVAENTRQTVQSEFERLTEPRLRILTDSPAAP